MSTHPNALHTRVTARPLACGPEEGGTGHRVELALPNGANVDLVVSIDPDTGGVHIDVQHDTNLGELVVEVDESVVHHRTPSW